MRKLENDMWSALKAGAPWKNTNTEVRVTNTHCDVIVYNCYLARVSYKGNNTYLVTFTGDAWHGASKTVMSRVRALCGASHSVKKIAGNVTFKCLNTNIETTADAYSLGESELALLVTAL